MGCQTFENRWLTILQQSYCHATNYCFSTVMRHNSAYHFGMSIDPSLMTSVSLADVPPTQSANYPGVCPDETMADYSQSFTWLPYKSHCYMFVTDEIEWPDAATSCARHGKTCWRLCVMCVCGGISIHFSGKIWLEMWVFWVTNVVTEQI